MNKKNYMSPSIEIIHLKAKCSLLQTSMTLNVNSTAANEVDDGSDLD